MALARQQLKIDLERLLILHDHLLDLLAVDGVAGVVARRAQVLRKAQLNFAPDLRLLDPLEQREALRVFNVFNLLALVIGRILAGSDASSPARLYIVLWQRIAECMVPHPNAYYT